MHIYSMGTCHSLSDNIFLYINDDDKLRQFATEFTVCVIL